MRMTDDQFRELITFSTTALKDEGLSKEGAIERAHKTNSLYEDMTGDTENSQVALKIALEVIEQIYTPVKH